MRINARIYLSVLVSQIGNWLTFLAIALLLKERLGGAHVAYAFLIQSVPALIFSRSFGAIIPPRFQYQGYLLTNLLLALSLLIVIFGESIVAVYVFLVLSSTLKALLTPLQNTMIGDWVDKENLAIVHTRVGSIQAATLALAPAMGGWIATQFGFTVLFWIDAASFLIAALIMIPRPKSVSVVATNWVAPKLRALFLTITPKPDGVPSEILYALIPWFAFLIAGAMINAIEFAVFEEMGLSRTDSGHMLTAWGLGSLLALFASKNLSGRLGSATLAFFCALGIAVWAYGGILWITLFGFGLTGLASAILAGKLRASVQSSVPSGFNALPVWAFANQILAFINIVIYAIAPWALKAFGSQAIAGVLVMVWVVIGITNLRMSRPGVNGGHTVTSH